MNVLDSVLINCEAENYAEAFKKHEIDIYTLKILSDEDLQIIGIEDKSIRENILKYSQNLQIKSEEKTDIIIDKQYINLVLNSSALQLERYSISFTIASKRDDVEVCNIKVTPGLSCLEGCLERLEDELGNFEEKVTNKTLSKRRKKYHPLIPVLAISTLVLVSCIKLIKMQNS